MKATRLLVLAVALIAGLGAAYLMMGNKEVPTQRIVVAPAIETDNVLVASHELGAGSTLSDADMRWQPFVKSEIAQGVIRQSVQPTAVQELKGMIVRTEIPAGEPMRRERLTKDAGFMSAVLPSGTRAVAIDLADQGKSAAGGFILPNDRVDVIRTYRPDDAPMVFASDTILTNVKVLAIGQAVQDKAGEHTAIGATATLELTPDQAEKVILAQRTGQLTLSLRSAADAKEADKPTGQPQTMTIIRFGNTTQARVR